MIEVAFASIANLEYQKYNVVLDFCWPTHGDWTVKENFQLARRVSTCTTGQTYPSMLIWTPDQLQWVFTNIY